MSHTLAQPGDGLRFGMLTIVNYVAGGEQVTASEVAAFAVDAVMFGTVPPSQNSLGVPLFPLLNAGKVMLFRFVSGSPAEIPPTTALNAVIPCIIHILTYATG